MIDAPFQHPELLGAFRKFFVGKTIAIEMKLQGAAPDGVFGALDPYTSKYVCPDFWFRPEMSLMRVPDLETKPAV